MLAFQGCILRVVVGEREVGDAGQGALVGHHEVGLRGFSRTLARSLARRGSLGLSFEAKYGPSLLKRATSRQSGSAVYSYRFKAFPYRLLEVVSNP